MKRSALSSFVLAAVALAGAAGCSAPTPSPVATPPSDVVADPRPPALEVPRSGEATLFLMADIHGVLRPCGCTVELQKGGFDRLIPYLTEERKHHPASALLHAGPLFYEAVTPEAKKKAQAERQAEVTADLVAQTGIAVAGATAFDDAASGGHLADLAGRAKVELTAANLTFASGKVPPGSVVKEVGGLRIGIFALAGSPDPDHPDQTGGAKLADPEDTATATVAELRKNADVVVLLSDLGLRETKRLVRKVAGIDFAVAGGMGEHPSFSEEAELVGDTRVMQFHNEGRYVGRLTLRMVGGSSDFADATQASPAELAQLDERVKRLDAALADLTKNRRPTDPEITSMTHELAAVKESRERLAGRTGATPTDRSSFSFTVTPIEWDLPQDPTAAALMKAFDEELARINIANAGTLPEPAPGQAVYVGTDACLDCHTETKAFWQANEHRHAWQTLVDAGKTFDTDCISCHVTGYGQPGGSLVGHTKDREAVQCEACHGPGSKHAQDSLASSIVRKPTEAVCAGCHTEQHSPRFKFGPYIEHLLVPGHGRPLN